VASAHFLLRLQKIGFSDEAVARIAACTDGSVTANQLVPDNCYYALMRDSDGVFCNGVSDHSLALSAGRGEGDAVPLTQSAE